MGMSNEQFDAYKTGQLRLLEIAKKEISENGNTDTLDQIINDLRSDLKKP